MTKRPLNRHEERASRSNGRRIAKGEWSPFRELTDGELAAKALALGGNAYLQSKFCKRIYLNSRYVAFEHDDHGADGWGDSIKRFAVRRIDGQPLHDWQDLQRVKNELAGPQARAVEVYPPASDLVDSAHLYHLWVWPASVPCPFDLFLPPKVTP